MYKLSVLLLLVVGLSSLVAAQDKDRRWELFTGYSYLMTDTAPEGPPIDQFNNLDGVNLAATRYLSKRFGITVDFSAHYRKNDAVATGGTVHFRSTSLSYLAGPHYRFSNRTRVTPFVHAMAGVSNSRFTFQGITTGSTTPAIDFGLNITDFSMAIGGGLDVRVHKRISIRAFQLDYTPVFIRDRPALGIDGRRFDNARFSIGVVFNK